ncbi:MAG: hypothetical protein FWH19_01435 [Treponema sp.]|nr:hypothetical protein [Treponema sp.]
MTHTKQDGCIAFIKKKNKEKQEITENLDSKALLIDSLGKLLAELDDFQKIAEKYFLEKKSLQKEKKNYRDERNIL